MLQLFCLFLLQNALGSLGIPWGLLGCFWHPSGTPLGPRGTPWGVPLDLLGCFRHPSGTPLGHRGTPRGVPLGLLGCFQQLVDQQLVYQQLVDQQLVDQQLLDQQLVDQLLSMDRPWLAVFGVRCSDVRCSMLCSERNMICFVRVRL